MSISSSDLGPSTASVVIGTAGHIDHGKTTLVRALTGVDTDRLSEEKKRGITIVLGFAPLDLGAGLRVGIVDVPGHEKFVRTMVAGAGGVDVGLLVVSAEEGVMPQTREHLEILKMLAVPRLVVALTRADLVDDDLVELAALDVEELLESVRGPWPEPAVVATSGITGAGIDELREALRQAAVGVPPRGEGAVFRMPIDRAFSIRGFGTVVTGTTRDGRLAAGESLEVLPSRRVVKIRGIQVHGEAAREVHRGRRVALNLQGTAASEVPPGSWLASARALACSDRLDVAFDLLSAAPWPLKNNARVRFLYGTAELVATVRLIDPDGGPAPAEVLPGARAWAQLALAEECGAVPGDRFVLRVESPMLTLGGGVILDPEPPLLRRRERPAAAALLGVLGDPDASPGERVRALLMRKPGEALDRDALRRRLPAGLDVAAIAATSRPAGSRLLKASRSSASPGFRIKRARTRSPGEASGSPSTPSKAAAAGRSRRRRRGGSGSRITPPPSVSMGLSTRRTNRSPGTAPHSSASASWAQARAPGRTSAGAGPPSGSIRRTVATSSAVPYRKRTRALFLSGHGAADRRSNATSRRSEQASARAEASQLPGGTSEAAVPWRFRATRRPRCTSRAASPCT